MQSQQLQKDEFWDDLMLHQPQVKGVQVISDIPKPVKCGCQRGLLLQSSCVGSKSM